MQNTVTITCVYSQTYVVRLTEGDINSDCLRNGAVLLIFKSLYINDHWDVHTCRYLRKDGIESK